MMTDKIQTSYARKFTMILLALVILGGIAARLYHITDNQFIYYDEGMWLNHQRGFVSFIEHNPPQSFADWTKILEISMHLSLATGKALWSFFAMLRGLIVGVEGWYFTRLISAISGILTLGVVYLFALKYFNSRLTAFLSAAILATLPSHLYYSRLGLQEGFSTLCFLLGMYFYYFPRNKISIRLLFSGFFFACVFFSNYRMIIIPFLVLFCEFFSFISFRQSLQVRKYIYSMLTFLMMIFLIGSIDNGVNTKVTFGWVFHQAHLADGSFDPINLLSYPYYLFRLESVVFGVLFFGNIYFIVKRDWQKLLPFFLSLLMMVMFSFAQEKGVRYVCAVMPFMAMAVATLIVTLFEERKNVVFKTILVALALSIFCFHSIKAFEILNFHSDYEQSMVDLEKENRHIKVASTQSNIQKIFSPDNNNVIEPPKEFKYLLAYYFKGFQYLIIDPQAYISFTEDGKRFTPKLKGYLNFIDQSVPPHAVYPHFNKALLERFVLEHNVNLRTSLEFLRLNESGKRGQLKVYDLTKCIIAIRHALDMSSQTKVK